MLKGYESYIILYGFNMNIAEQNNYYTLINSMCTSTANLQEENKTDQFLGASMDSDGDSFVVRTADFFCYRLSTLIFMQ